MSIAIPADIAERLALSADAIRRHRENAPTACGCGLCRAPVIIGFDSRAPSAPHAGPRNRAERRAEASRARSPR